MNKVLAVFDFDGTLTTKDTFLELIKYQKGGFSFWWGFLKMSPIVLLHLLKIIPNWRAKEHVLTYFFKGERLTDFQLECDRFSQDYIPKIIRKEALLKLEMHEKSGHDIIVVSASAENWLSGWCKSKNIRLVATRLEVVNGLLTGKIVGRNCYGPEKLVRLKQEISLENYKEVHVYGDSSGDKEILAIASHAFYRRF